MLISIFVELNSNTFFYIFSRDPRIATLPAYLPQNLTNVANHGAELVFTWGLPFYKQINASEADKQLSRVVMKYWANFIRTG